jgi:pyruvate dehydrogenase E2 component (dihydrolipoamide acetyltransferase)
MAEQITMPQLGLTMDEGTVFEWSKKENEPVKKGEVLLVVENDKSTVDVESQYEGILGKILVAEGETVPVGAPIAWIVAEGEEVPADTGGAAGTEEAETTPEAPAAGTEEATETPAAKKPAAGAGTAADGFVLASPRARALAAEKGVELAQIAGSGPEGSVLEKDVLAAVESGTAAPAAAGATAAPGAPVYATASGKPEEVSLTRVQAVGAERMVESWQNVPQFTLQREIDAEALLRLQAHFRETSETKISLNIVLAKIFAHAIAAHPRLNAEWIGNGKIRRHPTVNVGIAMDTANGLMVPVLKDCTTRGFAALAQDWQATAETVKAGKAGPAELTGATVTLSNLGMFGVGWFRAIVNPPQAAILALGGVERKPVETAGGIAFRSVIQATITADHRVVDGAYAARFMQSFAKMVENPVLIYEGV